MTWGKYQRDTGQQLVEFLGRGIGEAKNHKEPV